MQVFVLSVNKQKSLQMNGYYSKDTTKLIDHFLLKWLISETTKKLKKITFIIEIF